MDLDAARIKFNAPAARRVIRLGPAEWRKFSFRMWQKIGCGQVVASIRTLGYRLPSSDQKKALKIEGVQFLLPPNRAFTADHWMPLRGFSKVADARAYGDLVLAFMATHPEGHGTD